MSIFLYSNIRDSVDAEKIYDTVLTEGFAVISNVVAKNECRDVVNQFKDKVKASNDQPTIGSTPEDIQGYYQKLSVGGKMDGFDYRPRYCRVIYTPFWSPDIFKCHAAMRKVARLRNLLQGYSPNFAIDEIEDNCWSAVRLQQYPKGGGFFEEHRDVVLEEAQEKASLKRFLQILVLFTEKGEDFHEGGAFVNHKGRKLDLELTAKAGDVVVYSGASLHGVDDIDPSEVADTARMDGRIVGLVSLYQNRFGNLND